MVQSELYKDLFNASFQLGAVGPDKYDCWTLCMEVCKRGGLELPTFNSVVEEHLRSDVIQDTAQEMFTEIDGPIDYAIVTFKAMPDPNLVTHLGVCISEQEFLHIHPKFGVHVSRFDNMLWRKKIHGFFKLNTNN